MWQRANRTVVRAQLFKYATRTSASRRSRDVTCMLAFAGCALTLLPECSSGGRGSGDAEADSGTSRDAGTDSRRGTSRDTGTDVSSGESPDTGTAGGQDGGTTPGATKDGTITDGHAEADAQDTGTTEPRDTGSGDTSAEATLTVSPAYVVTGGGQTVTLKWSSSHASSCTGTGFSTGNAPSGSVTVVADDTAGVTTYSVKCGSETKSATVTTKAFDPTDPAEFGYSLAFGGPFKMSSIDCGNTRAPGFDWYVSDWWGGIQSCSGMSVDSNGVLSVKTVSGGGNQAYAGLQSNTKNAAKTNWVGNDFGGGWYFEVSFSVAAPAASGYATFWAPDTEFEFPGEQWPGEPTGFRHGLENDMFDCIAACGSPSDGLQSGERDWYGVYGGGAAQCKFPDAGAPDNSGYATGAFCYQNSGGNTLRITDGWTTFHTGGQLWLPGNEHNGMNGQFLHYLYATGSTPVLAKTDKYTDPPPTSPPPGGPTAKGPGILAIGDEQHFGLIIGAPSSTPLYVQWLRVWQLPTGVKRVQ